MNTNFVLALGAPGIDGCLALAITKLAIPLVYTQRSSYQCYIPWNKLRIGDGVILIGTTPKLCDEQRLLADHPVLCLSAVNSFNKDTKTFELKDDEDTSLSLLTWQHFFPEAPVPRVIQYITDYYTWKLTNPDSEPFCTGLMDLNLPPYDETTWGLLLKDDNDLINKLIEKGKKIITDRRMFFGAVCADLAYPMEWMGKRFLVMNTKVPNSLAFSSLDQTGIDGLITYQMGGTTNILDPPQFNVSIYRAKDSTLNCRDIAEQFGGYGRAGASGFRCNKLPFKEGKIDGKEPSFNRTYSRHEPGYHYAFIPYFIRVLNDTICVGINHPTLAPDIVNVVKSGGMLDCLRTGASKLTMLSWVWTNCGMYRFAVHKDHACLIPEGVTATPVEDELWWYGNDYDWLHIQ